jgi:hypothetical protein
MNFRPISALAGMACAVIASCYPVEEPNIKQGPATPQQPQLTPEQLTQKKAEEERVRAAEEDLRKQQAHIDNPSTTPNTNLTTSDYPFANKIPGKPGFVFSPYNNQPIDVRDIPTGTLVQDPTYPASEKKYFRVP